MAKILYFAALVDKLGSAAEDVTLPDTVNKQFSTLDTKIDNTCEIALISARAW